MTDQEKAREMSDKLVEKLTIGWMTTYAIMNTIEAAIQYGRETAVASTFEEASKICERLAEMEEDPLAENVLRIAAISIRAQNHTL